MITGVGVHDLKQVPDERGKVMHMLRKTDPWFREFGEIYFSTVYPAVVKGWHLHKRMTLNYAVIVGMIKLVIYDGREDSATFGQCEEFFIGESNYQLITIPPLIWNGFKGVGTVPAIVANCATMPHDPDEIVRKDPFDESIPYDWGLKQC